MWHVRIWNEERVEQTFMLQLEKYGKVISGKSRVSSEKSGDRQIEIVDLQVIQRLWAEAAAHWLRIRHFESL
jgi:hypothetical protein